MKVIIAGTTAKRADLLMAVVASSMYITEVVAIGPGAGRKQADDYARLTDVPITAWRMPRYGGRKTYEFAAEYADALIALDGGDGLRSMIREMQRLGKLVWVQP